VVKWIVKTINEAITFHGNIHTVSTSFVISSVLYYVSGIAKRVNERKFTLFSGKNCLNLKIIQNCFSTKRNPGGRVGLDTAGSP